MTGTRAQRAKNFPYDYHMRAHSARKFCPTITIRARSARKFCVSDTQTIPFSCIFVLRDSALHMLHLRYRLSPRSPSQQRSMHPNISRDEWRYTRLCARKTKRGHARRDYGAGRLRHFGSLCPPQRSLVAFAVPARDHTLHALEHLRRDLHRPVLQLSDFGEALDRVRRTVLRAEVGVGAP